MFRLKLLFVVIIILVGCENPMEPQEEYQFDISIENILPDENQFYHLELDNNNQTLQRLVANTNRTDIQKVYWVADKTYEYEYNGITFEVDIVNHASYTNDGYAHTMFGPFPTMIGDTVTVTSYYNDWEYDYSNTIKIILE
jgi:hypothetical protein